jgi:hypothetical protein
VGVAEEKSVSFREGARSGDPADICPGCQAQACHFASDFKMMGKKSVRVCIECKSVFLNGEKTADLEVYKKPDGG